MIDTIHKNVTFLDQINGKIFRSGVIDQHTINSHDLWYQCSKAFPDFLFGKFSIRDTRYRTHVPAKRKLLSSQNQMNTLLEIII